MGENLKQDRERLISAVTFQSENDHRFNHHNNPLVYSKLVAPIVSNSLKDYPALDKKGVFSYAKSEEDPTNPKNRITTTLGRYIRRVLKVELSELCDDYLTRFTDNVMAYSKEPDVKVLKGNDITKFYKNTEINSCMTNKHAYHTELYALNPKNVFLAVLRDNKKDVARAVLWKSDAGEYYLDRIYAKDNRKYELALERWAKEKGYITDWASDKLDKFKVTLKAKTYLPYLDTFDDNMFFSSKKKKLILGNFSRKNIPKGYKLFFGTGAGDFTPWTETKDCAFCDGHAVVKNNEHKYFLYDENLDKFADLYICEECSSGFVYKTCPVCKKKFVYDSEQSYCYFLIKSKPTCGKCSKKLSFRCCRCQNIFDIRKEKKHFRKDDYNPKQTYCDDCFKLYC